MCVFIYVCVFTCWRVVCGVNKWIYGPVTGQAEVKTAQGLKQEADAACSWCGVVQDTNWDQTAEHMAGLDIACVCVCVCSVNLLQCFLFAVPKFRYESVSLFNQGRYQII